MNFRVPVEDDWRKRAAEWNRFISQLFSFLQNVLGQGIPLDFAALREDLETWQPFTAFDDKRRNQLQTVHQLLWCAERAARIPDPDWDQIDRVRLAMAPIPDLIKGYEGWAFNCIRVLRKKDTPVRSLHIPVALADELLHDTGTIVALVLEVLEPGGGQVFPHPADTLRTYAHINFTDSLRDAWLGAKELVRKEGVESVFDGRWRLLHDNQPVREVSGRSASGAAARGWWFALTGKVLDEGVIVVAQVDENDTSLLKGVADKGVFAKTEEIVRNKRLNIDTIVVASESNANEAQAALTECGKAGEIKKGEIKVVNLEESQP